MKFGLNLINFGDTGDPCLLADLARDAETAGWDGFFIWDHLMMPWPVPFADVTVALAAIALATSRIRFGAHVTPLPRRSLVKFARETASLDQLSGGRLSVGIGLGNDDESAHAGAQPDPRIRAAMLDEGLEVLSALWRGEAVTHDGPHYHIDTPPLLPTPIQRPRIPIWLGGMWPNRAPFRRAARWDGMLPGSRAVEPNAPFPLDMLREVVAYTRDQRTASGPFDVVITGCTPGDDPARAAETVAAYAQTGATWWEELINGLRFETLTAMRDRILQGPPCLA